MSHYFLKDEHLKDEEIAVNFSFKGVEFHLVSNNGIFSKNKLDEGSNILIKTLLSSTLNGRFLDLGCGYGAVGIVCKYFNPEIMLTMSDINELCVETAQKNIKKYDFQANLIHSDGFKIIEDTFDYIAFNPPIRIGKEAIYKIYEDAYKHLNQAGHFLIVIRKDKGALSHKKYLETLFSKCELVNKECGYFVYELCK